MAAALAPAAAAGLAVAARSWFHIAHGTNDSTVSVRTIPLGIPANCCTVYIRPGGLTAAGLTALNVGCDTLGCKALLSQHATAANVTARQAGHAAAYPDEYADNAWLTVMIGAAPIHHGTIGSGRVAAARLAFIAAGGPAALQITIVAGMVHPLVAGPLTVAQAAAAAAYAAADQTAASVDHTAPPLPRDVPWRDPTADQAKTLTSIAMQLKLSQWKSNTTPQHFFDLIEGALHPIGLDPTVWVAIIPLMIPTTDSAVRKWVTDYITKVNPRLSWSTARRLFTERYGQQDYHVAVMKLYQDCRQSVGEPVQAYSQRFLTLAAELKVEEKDIVAIHQYEAGLVAGLRRAIDAVRISNRTTGLAPNREWNFRSLHELSQLTIQLETAYNSRNNTSTSLYADNTKNPLQSPLANPPDRKRKAVKDSESDSKTSPGRTKRMFKSKGNAIGFNVQRTVRGATITSSPVLPAGGNTTKSSACVICFRCKQKGHYVRDCPQPPPANSLSNSHSVGTHSRNHSNIRFNNNRLSTRNNKQQRRAARSARVKNNTAQATTTASSTETTSNKP